jgi:chromosome segregation ATPase
MGFLGFLRKERPETGDKTEEVSRVGIGEIAGWFEGSFSEDIEKNKSRGQELYQEVMDSFLGIRDSLRVLESAKFSGRERIHAAANMIKDTFVKKAYPIISSIERASRETEISFSGLRGFQEEASKTLEELKKTTPKQAVLLSRYFKKESDPVVGRIKETGEKISNLKKWLDDDVMLRLSENVRNRMREQLSDTGELDSLAKRILEIRKETKRMKDKKQEKESEFLELIRGREWNELNALEKDLKNIKSDIVRIEYEITNELSPMKRPLKKLEHILRKQDMLFNHKGFLRGFIQDPFGSIREKNGEDTLRRFLFTMNRMVHDKKIDLKDKEREKLENLMERMERSIPELKKRYRELMEDRESKEKRMGDLSDSVKSKQELESEIEGYSRDISEMDEEARNIAREQERLKENIGKRSREMEELILRETGREVEILN